MDGRYEDISNPAGQEAAGGKGGFVFYLILPFSIILPPLGLAVGLVMLTAGTDEAYSQRGQVRGKVLIAVSLIAFILQIIFGIVFLLPRAIEYMGTNPLFANYPGYPGNGINPSGYRASQHQEDVAVLLQMLDLRVELEFARQRYDEALKAIERRSSEPLPRYIAAAALAFSEIGERIIQDDDERNEEVGRLIREALELDGKNTKAEATLDAIMLTPLMQVELRKGNIEEAEKINERLLAPSADGIHEFYITMVQRWAYNSWFEHWQIRDPDKSFDIALQTIRRMGWHDGQLRLQDFLYGYYGGLSNVYLLARRLGREDEFFELLKYFIDVAEQSSDPSNDLPGLCYLMGSFLGYEGRWDEALPYMRRAYEKRMYRREFRFAVGKTLYESGKRTEAADFIFDGIVGDEPVFSMDEMRFLYFDHPAEGAEYLRPKLAYYPDNPGIAGNLAIMAHRAGDHELARAAVALMMAIEAGDDAGSELPRASAALAKGDVDGAMEIIDGIDIDEDRLGDSTYVRAMVLPPDAPPEETVDMTLAALKVSPFDRDPDFSLYETCFAAMQESGRTEEAFKLLRKLVELAPGEPRPRLYLGGKLHELGYLEESMEVLEDLQVMLGAPHMTSAQLDYFEFHGNSAYWFNRLNRVDYNEVFLEMAEVAREMGNMDDYDHYLFRADAWAISDFGTELIIARREIEKGKLEKAGRILDNLSFYAEVDDKNGQAYRDLMAAYETLRAAGWVRERNFEPIFR